MHLARILLICVLATQKKFMTSYAQDETSEIPTSVTMIPDTLPEIDTSNTQDQTTSTTIPKVKTTQGIKKPPNQKQTPTTKIKATKAPTPKKTTAIKVKTTLLKKLSTPAQTTIGVVTATLPGVKKPKVPSRAEWSRLLNATKLHADLISNEGKKPQPPEAGMPLNNTNTSKLSQRSGVIAKHIVNGIEAYRGQWAWQVVHKQDNAYICGGSLINGEWVLTAGHCVYNRTNFVVKIGVQDRSVFEEGRLSLQTSTQILHEDYNPLTLLNDIGLIKLPYEISMPGDYWNSIRLPSRSQLTTTFEGEQGIISGFGKTSDKSLTSETLNWASVTVMSTANCSLYYREGFVTASNICIWSSYRGTSISACKGDSGGPLAYKEADGLYTLIGITSFVSGLGCEKLQPAGYVRVTSFMRWISDQTGIAIQD